MTLHKRTYKRGIAISVYLSYVFFTLLASLKRKDAFQIARPNSISVENNYSKFLCEHGDVLTNLYKCINRGASKVWETTMTRRAQAHIHIRRIGLWDGGISFFQEDYDTENSEDQLTFSLFGHFATKDPATEQGQNHTQNRQ
jgi:hypothetical protein